MTKLNAALFRGNRRNHGSGGGGGGGGDAYAISGQSPELVLDFEGATYRVAGASSTFASATTFARASTATYFDSNGDLQTATSGTARESHYRYNGSSFVAKGIRFESDARTNIIPRSKVSTTGWSTQNATISNDATTDFILGSTAEVTETSGSGLHYVFQAGISAASNSIITYSAYVKRGSGTRNFAISNGQLGARFDLDAQTATSISTGPNSNYITGGVETVASGEFRCWFVGQVDTTGMAPPINNITLSLISGTSQSYTGDGTSSLFLNGAQMEIAYGPSSYIATTGSTATRAAETLTVAAANTTPSTTALSLQMDGEITYLDEGTAAQQTFLRWQSDASNYVSLDLDTDGAATGEVNANQAASATVDTVVAAANYTAGVNVAFNIASRHEDGEINVAKDGTAATADTTPTALVDLSAVDMNVGHNFNGTIAKLRLWESVGLADADLETAST